MICRICGENIKVGVLMVCDDEAFYHPDCYEKMKSDLGDIYKKYNWMDRDIVKSLYYKDELKYLDGEWCIIYTMMINEYTEIGRAHV